MDGRVNWIQRTGAVAVLAVMLAGCAVPSHPVAPAGPDQPRLLAVPFFPDDTDQCGPATLASVLTFWGVPTEPQGLKPEIYLPKLKGVLPTDLAAAARERGLEARAYRGSLDDLKAEVTADHPLVAFLNLGSTLFPQGHYVVVTGFDDRRQGLYVHSGLERNAFMSYDQFLRHWQKTGRWTLLVLPRNHNGRA